MEKITEPNSIYSTNNIMISTEGTNLKKDTSSIEDTEFMILEIEACNRSRR
jgi:hypothetical protein